MSKATTWRRIPNRPTETPLEESPYFRMALDSLERTDPARMDGLIQTRQLEEWLRQAANRAELMHEQAMVQGRSDEEAAELASKTLELDPPHKEPTPRDRRAAADHRQTFERQVLPSLSRTYRTAPETM